MGITDKEQLESALQQLNSNMKKLAEVFQHNQRVFTGGFELVEMHHFVERRVLNDLFLGTVRFTDPVVDAEHPEEDPFAAYTDEEGYVHQPRPGRRNTSKIDWDWYYAEFKRCVKDDVAKGVLEFCDIKLKVPEPEAPAAPAEAASEAPPEGTTAVHTAPSPGDADFVFGGDYAGQQVG